MATGAPIPVREYASVAEMRRHALEVKARLFSGSLTNSNALAPAILPPVEPKPVKSIWGAPVIVEHQPIVTLAQVHADVMSVADVTRVVAAATGITKAQLRSVQRKFDVARARHITCWLAAKHSGLSLNQVGARLGGRDHTTVLYGERRVAAVIAVLGLDMSGDPHRQARVLWDADWPKVVIGPGRRPCA
ncbi:hypothetical protein MKK88_10990 [Methylobacterium sp. E-005]|uniref:helix-turn-helix domain-containing protein n=1 Tax=Methylobacterium sp. E-005 TaxID=2836549 RepID=UPI001FBA5DA5|nr:helix-turn-helix domain-containing protein [Methylobacterium sp. E-005]MCJ2086512.1 hypothetical protein [Methylobacterium sp. E-005]